MTLPEGGETTRLGPTGPSRARSRLRLLLPAAAVLLGLTAVAVTAIPASRRPRAVGGNAPVNAGGLDTGDITAHNSPTVAVNPRDPRNVVVSNRIDSPAFSCALHVSTDGGATFRHSPIEVPEGEEPKCFAPDVAYGADGTLFMTFVTLKGIANVPNAVWIVRSDDGGVTLSEPSRLLGPLSFQVRLVADPAVPDVLHVTWLRARETAILAFPEVGYPIMATRSDDGGRTWTDPVRLSPEGRLRVVAPSPAAGRRGELVVAYLDLGEDRLDYHGGHQGFGGPPYPGFWQLVVARSADGGRSWTERVVEPRLVPTERFVVFLPPFPSAVADGAGRVYVGYHDGRRGDADVWVWGSSDGGATFAPPVRVNDTRPGDGTTQHMARLAVAPGGRLDVVYYDRRADARDVMNEVSFQSSFDGGETFTPRVALTTRPFDSRIGLGSERGLPDLGSRIGLVSIPDRAMAVWTDTRAGTQASNKQDIMRALVVFTGTAPLEAPLVLALRLGGALVALLGLALLVLRGRGRGG